MTGDSDHCRSEAIVTTQAVELKFCVLYRGSIWYVSRSMGEIKNVMNKIQRDKNNTEAE